MRNDQDRPEVHQKDDVRERDQEDLFDQRVAQRVDGLLDERRTIVEGHDRHARRQPRLDLCDARLDGVDDRLRVDAGARHDDATDRFLAFP